MGYRLDIYNKSQTINFYGTKLYGYCDHTKLLSYQYLVSIGKFKGDEVFCYETDVVVELTPSEFKIFIVLYKFDYESFNNYMGSLLLKDPDIEKLIQSEENKIVGWC